MSRFEATQIDELAGSLHERAKAVIYLRVSTKEQAEKGGQDEGYSIPAQRAANLAKAEQLDADVIEEFVDAGESARSADRPALLRLLSFIQKTKVSYCIVHKVDRLARNRADDVAIHLALQQAGCVLVSASENIDETPSGLLLHGIMSSIAEFYSANLATETVKGLRQKAITGGTPHRAPVGYLNVGRRDESGREVRTVEVDPQRGPLISWAFKAFASGDWTESQLRDQLARKGLTSVPTPKRPAAPMSKNSVHLMLTNPYYQGDVIFQGDMYKGCHTPLVPPEVFAQVQLVLKTHSTASDRTQLHDHYLKGSLYCGLCGSRLIITHAKNGQGVIYPYFVCAGRHSKTTDCYFQAIPICTAEQLVIDYYDQVRIPPAQQGILRQALNTRFDELMATARPDLAAKTKLLTALQDEQVRVARAHSRGDLDDDVLARVQRELRDQLAQVRNEINILSNDYTENRHFLDDCLALTGDPKALYTQSNADTRRLANQVFFRKLFIDETAQGAPPKACYDMRSELHHPFDLPTVRRHCFWCCWRHGGW